MGAQAKNVYLDTALLARMESIGKQQKLTVDQVVAEAVVNFLRATIYQNTLSWAHDQNKSSNLNEDEQLDIAVEAVHEWRSERACSH